MPGKLYSKSYGGPPTYAARSSTAQPLCPDPAVLLITDQLPEHRGDEVNRDGDYFQLSPLLRALQL